MSHLRTKLEHATREYQAASYPGNLALDVLGPANSSSRWSYAPLAIAAALAVGVSVGIFAGRWTGHADELAATNIDATPTPVDVTPPANNAPVAKPKVQTPTAVAGAFTVVPTSGTFTRSVSVVPDLETLETKDEDATGTTAIASANTDTHQAAYVPMSLMLLSASEYDAQQAAAEKTKSTTNTEEHS